MTSTFRLSCLVPQIDTMHADMYDCVQLDCAVNDLGAGRGLPSAPSCRCGSRATCSCGPRALRRPRRATTCPPLPQPSRAANSRRTQTTLRTRAGLTVLLRHKAPPSCMLSVRRGDMPLPIGRTLRGAHLNPAQNWTLYRRKGRGRHRSMSRNANDPSQMTPGVDSGG